MLIAAVGHKRSSITRKKEQPAIDGSAIIIIICLAQQILESSFQSGICFTTGLSEAERTEALKQGAKETGLPSVDPITTGVQALVERL